jgi:hypothetical protein
VFFNKRIEKLLCDKHSKQLSRYGEIQERNSRDPNEIVDCGEYLEIIMYDRKFNETSRAKIDKEDECKINKYKWHLDSDGYAHNGNGKRGHILMQNLIMSPSEGEIVDHKEWDRLDNRKENLRITDYSGNSANTRIHRNNKTGVTGVMVRSEYGTWRACITHKGRAIELGSYKTKKDAVRARLTAEIKYYPDLPPQRHLFEEYGISVEEGGASVDV